jgi:hypothetical protein
MDPQHTFAFIVSTHHSQMLCNSPFGVRCKAIHDPGAKGPAESWLRHTKFPLCSKVLNLDSVPYIDHRHTITSELIHEGNPMGIDLVKESLEDQFDAFYKRVTNNCEGIDILAMTMAAVFLNDSSENLLKYNPTHSYLGQACSVESKVFLVRFSMDSGAFSVHEIPLILNTTMIPHVIVAHLIKVGQPSKSNPVRVYFGSLPDLELVSKDDIKAAIRKHGHESNELHINLPYVGLHIPGDDDALGLVRDILHHKISSSEGTLDATMSKEKSKELLKRFTSLVHFFQNQWFPTNKTHDHSLNATVPSARSVYDIRGLCSNTEHLWTSFLENMAPRPDSIDVVPVSVVNSERFRVFLSCLANNRHVENVPHINWNANKVGVQGSAATSCKLMWKDILVNQSESWDSLKEFYSQY